MEFIFDLFFGYFFLEWQGSGKEVECGAFDFQPVRLGLRNGSGKGLELVRQCMTFLREHKRNMKGTSKRTYNTE